MGSVFSYMLYFRKEQLADVLLGLAEMAENHSPPTLIQFPDNVIEIPFETWGSEDCLLHHEDAELGFQIAMFFDMDSAISEWGHWQVTNDSLYISSNGNWMVPISVGYIYLTIYNDLRQYYPEIKLDLKDLVLFEFSSTGKRMSILFASSLSIRKRFLEILKQFNGICGVFNNEINGEVFWIDGHHVCFNIDDPWLSPEEIKSLR